VTEPALEIRSLSYSIRSVPILRDVSVRILAGETWSILGPNGAGKSTLLKCLVRICKGWKGRVELFGRTLEAYSQRELARRIAYVPQAGGDQRYPFTVRELVRMGRYPFSGPFGSSHPGDETAIERALTRVGCVRFAHRTLDTLSGGERQKVLIAAALAQGGDVLLLDEPTAFLDYRHQAEVTAILRVLNHESGATIVTVTHDVNAAIVMGGNALALRDGHVAYCGPTSGLNREGCLNGIFDTAFRFLDDPVTGLRLVAPQGGRS
jgi:iron complex transport system ATP-binding protein